MGTSCSQVGTIVAAPTPVIKERKGCGLIVQARRLPSIFCKRINIFHLEKQWWHSSSWQYGSHCNFFKLTNLTEPLKMVINHLLLEGENKGKSKLNLN